MELDWWLIFPDGSMRRWLKGISFGGDTRRERVLVIAYQGNRPSQWLRSLS